MSAEARSRRETLRLAALGAIAAAGFARPALAGAQSASDEDLRDFLVGAISLEQLAVLAYSTAAREGDTDIGPTLETFRDQEQAHANALRQALDTLGFDVPDAPDSATDTGAFEDVDGLDSEQSDGASTCSTSSTGSPARASTSSTSRGSRTSSSPTTRARARRWTGRPDHHVGRDRRLSGGTRSYSSPSSGARRRRPRRRRRRRRSTRCRPLRPGSERRARAATGVRLALRARALDGDRGREPGRPGARGRRDEDVRRGGRDRRDPSLREARRDRERRPDDVRRPGQWASSSRARRP